jgi:hypothetical protein
MSTTSPSDGSGGNIHSFCAMNSLRMSVWIVPPSASSGMPRRLAMQAYIASSMAAGALIVIETVTSSSGMPANRSSMSASVSIATPSRPTSPSARAASES